MKYRTLRIAWSAGCGVLCLLMIILWARSFYAPNRIAIVRSPIGTVCLYSAAGQLIAIATFTVVKAKYLEIRANGASTRIIDPPLDFIIYPESFGAGRLTNASCLQLPYWFLFTAFLAISTCPWLRWSNRFSLRTLLIATTLVAVVLGLAVYAVGK